VVARAAVVAASTGAACHHGDPAPSPVLTAMGVAPEDARGAVRLSVGRETTAGDVATAAAALVGAWRALTG
jgi:cysteine desulfurase